MTPAHEPRRRATGFARPDRVHRTSAALLVLLTAVATIIAPHASGDQAGAPGFTGTITATATTDGSPPGTYRFLATFTLRTRPAGTSGPAADPDAPVETLDCSGTGTSGVSSIYGTGPFTSAFSCIPGPTGVDRLAPHTNGSASGFSATVPGRWTAAGIFHPQDITFECEGVIAHAVDPRLLPQESGSVTVAVEAACWST